MNDHLFGKKLFIQFTVRVYCERFFFFFFLYVCWGGGGRGLMAGLWYLIVLLVSDHCLSSPLALAIKKM